MQAHASQAVYNDATKYIIFTVGMLNGNDAQSDVPGIGAARVGIEVLAAMNSRHVGPPRFENGKHVEICCFA